jgi:hypothetical protein
MPRQADRLGTGQTGPLARRPAAGHPRSASRRPSYLLFPGWMGEAAQLADRHDRGAPSAAPLPPDLLPRVLQIREAHRLLVAGGFDEGDAAALIGYVVGLAECDSRWSLGQINRLLFLRDLYSNKDWDKVERLQN